jgi:hypothetical protein
MTHSIETKLGVPDEPAVTEKKYTEQDQILEYITTDLCEVLCLSHSQFHNRLLFFIVDSLNQRKGHPARVIFLKLVFAYMKDLEGNYGGSKLKKMH